MSLTCKAKRAMDENYVIFLLLLSVSMLSSLFQNKHSELFLSAIPNHQLKGDLLFNSFNQLKF